MTSSQDPERIMTASYADGSQTLSVCHPQWGEIARWSISRADIHDYFPKALLSKGPHPFPTELYRLIKSPQAVSLTDYGLLQFPPKTDSTVSAMLLQAYRKRKKVLIIETSTQDSGSLFCIAPMFVQAGPDRAPRLSLDPGARGGLQLPPSILHVVFSD